jgi:hypothetical protein
MGFMKTTVEIPDALFRQAKVFSAQKGISLKTFFTEAVKEQLRRKNGAATENPPAEPAWKKGFGGLRHLHKENLRIQKLIDEEFGKIDEEQWR